MYLLTNVITMPMQNHYDSSTNKKMICLKNNRNNNNMMKILPVLPLAGSPLL